MENNELKISRENALKVKAAFENAVKALALSGYRLGSVYVVPNTANPFTLEFTPRKSAREFIHYHTQVKIEFRFVWDEFFNCPYFYAVDCSKPTGVKVHGMASLFTDPDFKAVHIGRWHNTLYYQSYFRDR
jgi:hypothetical protein